MLKTSRLLLGAFVALLVLALGVSAATALRSISVSGGPRVSASSRLTFGEQDREGRLNAEREVICNITLLREISSAIAKRRGAIIGRVTGVAIELRSCESAVGVVTEVSALRTNGTRSCTAEVILCTVDWNLVYDSIEGTLPRITRVRFHIERSAFRFIVGGISCLYSGESFGIINVEAAERIRTAEADLRNTRLTKNSEFFCLIASSNPGTFDGRFAVSPTLTISLI